MLNLVNPVKADLRRPATALSVLIWAYADERVRIATNNDGRLASTGFAQADYGAGDATQGAINAWLDAHEDALLIDAKAREWFSVGRMFYFNFSRAMEARKLLPKACEVEQLHAVPVCRPDGRIKEFYLSDQRHAHPSYCMVEWQGYTAAELRGIQLQYDLFVALLEVLPQIKLSKWRVTGTGLTVGGESLTKR